MDCDEIRDKGELASCFMHFFKQGVAGDMLRVTHLLLTVSSPLHTQNNMRTVCFNTRRAFCGKRRVVGEDGQGGADQIALD